VKRGIFLFLFMVLMISGCTGGSPEAPEPAATATPVETTTPPPAVTEAPTTTSAPSTTQPSTTQPPTTEPPVQEDKYSLQTTSASELLPSGATNIESIGDDYTAVLKYPVRVGTVDEDAKATYGQEKSYEKATGAVDVLKYSSPDHAADMVNAIVSKGSYLGTPFTEKTLNSDGKTLKVYHRVEFKEYMATLLRRGAFIVHIEMVASESDAENYVRENLADLFGEDAPTQTIPLAGKDIDLLSTDTQIRDTVPDGAAIETLADIEYQYTLKFPPKPAGYVKGIKATYSVPAGNIYVFQLDSIPDAEEFLTSVKDKFQRSGNAPVMKTISKGGKSVTVYDNIQTGYQGTLIQKGAFVYYVSMSKDEFDAEFYITRKLGYLFE